MAWGVAAGKRMVHAVRVAVPWCATARRFRCPAMYRYSALRLALTLSGMRRDACSPANAKKSLADRLFGARSALIAGFRVRRGHCSPATGSLHQYQAGHRRKPSDLLMRAVQIPESYRQRVEPRRKCLDQAGQASCKCSSDLEMRLMFPASLVSLIEGSVSYLQMDRSGMSKSAAGRAR